MMKKVLFAAAMMLTMGTTVATSAAEKVSLRGQASVEMDYQTINIKDLPQAVEEVGGTKTYKVTFLDKDGVETVVVYGENGEEQE